MKSGEASHPFLFDADDEPDTLTLDLPEQTIPDDYVPEALPYSGERAVPIVHKEHAYAILDTLMDAYQNEEYPYSLESTRTPHDPRHMPTTLERGGVDHAMFLFNVCYYMRGGIKSNDAVKRLSKVYDEWPELFNCEEAQYFDEETIVQILSAHGLGFQKTVAKQWVENSRRMLELYDGDPRNIFDGVTTYEDSQDKVQNDGKGNGFLGFKEKMTSMIIYYLMDDELIEPFNFPIPVDLHVMRVSIANEMITFGDAPHGTNLFSPETTSALRDLYLEYAEERDVDARRLCNAVWMLSESLCGQHPGNTTIEPFGRKVRNGRSTYLIPKTVDVADPAQQKAYERSCRECPVEETCKYNIPGTQYYVGGNLIIRGNRMRFPLPMPVVVRPPVFEQPELF